MDDNISTHVSGTWKMLSQCGFLFLQKQILSYGPDIAHLLSEALLMIISRFYLILNFPSI